MRFSIKFKRRIKILYKRQNNSFTDNQTGLGPVDKLDLERGMKINHSELEEKQQAGQSLSMFFDEIMSDFTHILWTRALLSLNALKKACGGRHRGAFSACSGLKLHSRRARSQFVNRS